MGKIFTLCALLTVMAGTALTARADGAACCKDGKTCCTPKTSCCKK